MKTAFRNLSISAAIFATISLYAQQTTAPDSIVQVAAEAQGLSLAAWTDLPENGTFWLVTSNGIVAPDPAPLFEPGLPVYQITNDEYLVDATAGEVVIDTEAQQTVTDALAELSNDVVTLINQVQDTQTSQQTAMSSRTAGGVHALDDGGGFTPDFSLDTNGLYLQISNVADGLVFANLLNGTGFVYAIWGSTNLATPVAQWQVETELWPTNGTTNTLPFTVNAGDNANLFLKAQDWSTAMTNGLYCWWLWENFQSLDYTAGTVDSQGNTLGYDYSNNLDPNVISFTVRLGNQHFNTEFASGSYQVLGGTPSYEAVLINDTNQDDAVWQQYDGTVHLNLGTTDGVYTVQIGLKGLAPNATATWLGTTVYLDRVAPQIAITNPVLSTVATPYVQVQGYATEELQSVTYDVSNAVGVVTNQTGQMTGSYLDTNLLAYTTNGFQCYDIQLTNGLNVITVHAVDLAGNETTTNLNLTLDYSIATNPVIQLVWPQNGMQLCQSRFTVRGWTEDSSATVTAQITDTNGDTNVINGMVERTGVFWVDNLPLAEGTNTVALWVTNAAGLGSETNFSVVKSDMTLTLTDINGDLWYPTVSVSGNISDATAAVWVNGVQGTNNGDGTWSAAGVPVSAGGVASFDVTTSPTNGPDPDMNTNLDKPDQVVTESAQWSDVSTESGPGPREDGSSVGNYSDTAGGEIHNVTTDYSTNGEEGEVTEDLKYGADLSFISDTIVNGFGEVEITNGEDGLEIVLAEGALNWQTSDGLYNATQTARVKRVFQMGGRGSDGQQVLVVAGANATEELAATPFSEGLALDTITDGEVGPQDAGGNAYAAKAAGSPVEITASAGAPFYFFTDGAGKYTLVHQTECAAVGNTNNDRTTIGIGEVVDFSGMPGNTTWSVSGNGTISSTNGGGTTFTASMSPGGATVTATIDSVTIPTTLNVVAPSSITVVSNVDWPLGTENTNGTQMGAETIYTDIIGPTSVSFYNVYFRENPDPATMAITWPNGTNTTISFDRSTSPWGISCGSSTTFDTITAPAVPISYIFNGTNYVDFSFVSSWTDQYKNENGAWVDFFTLMVKYEYRGSDKKCRVTYLGNPGGWQGPY